MNSNKKSIQRPKTSLVRPKQVAKPVSVGFKKVVKTSPATLGRRPLSSQKHQTDNVHSSGIIDDVWSTGKSVASTVAGLAEGNPLSLLEIPNSVMKVIDTTKNIIRNVSQNDAKEKVVLPTHSDLNTVQDNILIDKLKKTMPVITTSQIPSSYATEYSQPPLVVTERTMPDGRKVTNVNGTFALPPCSDDGIVDHLWNYKYRMTPVGGLVFGSRVEALSNTFQMWRLNSTTATFIPTQGTDFVGNYTMNFMEGTDIAAHYDTSVGYQDASQREFTQPGTLKQGSTLTYKGKGDWLYIFNNLSEPLKFFTSTTFGVLTYNYAPPAIGANKVGYVLFSFDLDFMSQSENPLSFNNHMLRMFKGVWITSCRVDITFSQWCALAYHMLNCLSDRNANFLQPRLIDNLLRLNSSNQKRKGREINSHQALVYASGQLAEDPLQDDDDNHIVSIIRNELLDSFPQIVREYQTREPLDIVGKDSVKLLSLCLQLYFHDSGLDIVNFSLLSGIAKRIYRRLHPYSKSLLEIPDSDDDEDDKIYVHIKEDSLPK